MKNNDQRHDIMPILLAEVARRWLKDLSAEPIPLRRTYIASIPYGSTRLTKDEAIGKTRRFMSNLRCMCEEMGFFIVEAQWRQVIDFEKGHVDDPPAKLIVFYQQKPL